MHWNHRIVKYKDGQGYGLHEVYYDDDGKECGMTENPIYFAVGDDDGPEGVIKSLELALKDAKTRPVFVEPEVWPGKNWDTEVTPSCGCVFCDLELELVDGFHEANGVKYACTKDGAAE